MCLLKKAYIFVVSFLLIFFAGCSCGKGLVWESGENYEVTNTGSADKKAFKYQVFDNQHNVIDSGFTGDIEPIFYGNDNNLRLSVNYGSGATEYKYYDVSKGVVSELYKSILSDRYTKDGILVAYLAYEDNTVVVAVQDAFDKKVFYKTYEGEYPIKFSPSTQAEFISDDQIRITYLSGENDDEKTELLTIN